MRKTYCDSCGVDITAVWAYRISVSFVLPTLPEKESIYKEYCQGCYMKIKHDVIVALETQYG